MLRGAHGVDALKYLFDHYRIQVTFQEKNAREIEVPDHLTKEDASIIVAELQMLFG